jgi:hypothetical protein
VGVDGEADSVGSFQIVERVLPSRLVRHLPRSWQLDRGNAHRRPVILPVEFEAWYECRTTLHFETEPEPSTAGESKCVDHKRLHRSGSEERDWFELERNPARSLNRLRPNLSRRRKISHSRANDRVGIGGIQILRRQNQRGDNLLQCLV